MAIVTAELHNNLTRQKSRHDNNPWQWFGQIVITNMTDYDRAKLNTTGNNYIIPMTGTIEDGPDLKKRITDVLQAKVKELKQLTTPPVMETTTLNANETVKTVLTTLEQLNANESAKITTA